MAGSQNESKRARYENNERFDATDAQAEGDLRVLREQALVKGLIGGISVAGFSSGQGDSIGTVLQSDAITSPGANQIQLGGGLFVGIDADGLMLVKSTATGALTYSSVPAGQSTLYAYGLDTPSDSAQRFFSPASAPFTEFALGINTRYTLQVGLIAVAGNATISEMPIGGVTHALVALALLGNAAGTVTVTALFNNQLQTVPPIQLAQPAMAIANGGTPGVTTYSYVVVARTRNGAVVRPSNVVTTATGNVVLSALNFNRLSWNAVADALDYIVLRTVGGATQGIIGTVVRSGTNALRFDDTGLTGDGTTVPTTTFGGIVAPTSATDRASSVASLFALSKTEVALIADMKFKGSRSGTAGLQTQANNFRAFDPLRNGIDVVERNSLNVITIGDGVTTFGTLDAVDYANHDVLFSAALALAASTTKTEGQTTVVVKAGTYTLTSGGVVVPSGVRLIGEQPAWPNPSANGMKATIILNGNSLTLSTYSSMERLNIQLKSTAVDGAANLTCSVVLSGHNLVRDCFFTAAYAAGFTASGTSILTTTGASVPDVTIDHCRFLHDSAITAAQVFVNGITLTNASNATIRDCLFYANNMASGAAPATMLTLATCYDVQVRGCKFFSGYGAGVVNAATALAVVSGFQSGYATAIVFHGCEFYGGDDGGNVLAQTPSVFSLRGLYINDSPCVEVTSCSFLNLTNGVYQEGRTSTGATDSTNIHHSRFVNLGVAAFTVTNPTNSALTIGGVQFTDNYLSNMRSGVVVLDTDGAGSFTVTDLTIARNHFRSFGTVDGSSGNAISVTLTGSLSGWSCDQNLFVSVLNTPVYFWVKTAGNDWRISRNVFESCSLVIVGQNAANAWAALIGNGLVDNAASGYGTLKNIRICENQGSTINQNINSGTANSVIAFGADTVTDLHVCDNQFSDINGAIGASQGRGFCVEIRPYAALIGVKIIDNTFGSQNDSSKIGGIRLYAGSNASSASHQWQISRNQIYYRYDNTSTTTGGGALPGWNFLIQLQLGNQSVYHSNLMIDHNQFHFVAASVTTGTFNNHVISITAFDADCVAVLNNQTHISQAGMQFSVTRGATMTVSNGAPLATANSYKIIGNSCASAGSGTDTLFTFNGRLAGAGSPVPTANFVANTSIA